MPNLSPVPDCKQNLQKQLDIIKRDGKIQIMPFGSITVGQAGKELSDMEGMAPFVAGFSDDGRGVQSKEIMRAAMERAKSTLTRSFRHTVRICRLSAKDIFMTASMQGRMDMRVFRPNRNGDRLRVILNFAPRLGAHIMFATFLQRRAWSL